MPHQPDPQLDRRLRRRGLLGVAAGTAATALLGAAATPATATAARGHGRPVLPPGRSNAQDLWIGLGLGRERAYLPE